MVYLSTSSLGIITFLNKTSDKNVLHILTVSKVLVKEGKCDSVGLLSLDFPWKNLFFSSSKLLHL